MDRVRRLLTVAGIFCVVGCRPTLITDRQRRALRALKVEEAQADARRAAAAGDWRLLSVGGIGVQIIGTPLMGGQADIGRGERFLEGTADYLQDEDQSQLNANARQYAERYNQEIIRLGGYRPFELNHIAAGKAALATQEATKK